ncbi:MAG: EI24 domain-containing protein [Sphingorhabdus sp.]
MIRAFTLAVASLSDRRIFAVLVKSVLATGAIFLLLGIGLWFGIDGLADSWLGDAKGWIATTVAIASVITTILSAWLLFRIVAITVIWFFADDIVEAVEQKHYPVAGLMGKRPNAGQSAGLATRSILRVIGYNALALPLYILLLITGVGAALVFLLVNAMLLGRDLEDMLAIRHGRTQNHMGKFDRLLLGLGGTAGMMIPIVNLLIPVIATAMAVHLMHGEDEKMKARI